MFFTFLWCFLGNPPGLPKAKGRIFKGAKLLLWLPGLKVGACCQSWSPNLASSNLEMDTHMLINAIAPASDLTGPASSFKRRRRPRHQQTHLHVHGLAGRRGLHSRRFRRGTQRASRLLTSRRQTLHFRRLFLTFSPLLAMGRSSTHSHGEFFPGNPTRFQV